MHGAVIAHMHTFVIERRRELLCLAYGIFPCAEITCALPAWATTEGDDDDSCGLLHKSVLQQVKPATGTESCRDPEEGAESYELLLKAVFCQGMLDELLVHRGRVVICSGYGQKVTSSVIAAQLT